MKESIPSFDRQKRNAYAMPSLSHTRLRQAIALAILSILGSENNGVAHEACSKTRPPFVDLATSPRNPKKTILADPVYSMDRNHWGKALVGYESAQIRLPEEIIEKLIIATKKIRQELIKLGMNPTEASRIHIIVKDGYRPHETTNFMADYAKKFEPTTLDKYVTGIDKVSGHNNGKTVDLTIGLKDEQGTVHEIWMGSYFDEFNGYAHHAEPGRVLNRRTDDPLSYDANGFKKLNFVDTAKLRELLKNVMADIGGKPLQSEWWHYSFGRGQCYDTPIR